MSSVSGDTFCKHCPTRSCVTYEGAPYCLLHYHAFSAHSKDDEIKAVVTNEREAAKQQIHLEPLMRDAITEVILRMHEYQQKEQKALSEDPLSILSLNAPSNISNVASMDVSVPTTSKQKEQKRKSTASEIASKSKKLKRDDLWHSSKNTESTSHDTDAMVGERSSDRHENAKLKLVKQLGVENDDEDNEYLYTTGPPCSKCSSTDTYVKYDGSSSRNMSSTKSEIWGFKDSEDTQSKSTIICRTCKLQKVEIA